MKTLVTTLNAKYIHTSLALRWLYVANKDNCDIRFCEYSLKEKNETIVKDISDSGCDILGLSVYIWNVNRMAEIIPQLKINNPELIIILGGPEVTYEPAHFLNKWPVDYVISGEGEFVLGQLIHAIETNKEVQIPGVSTRSEISKTIAKADLDKLVELPSPYMLDEDKESIINRLVYFETSRGCPYQCQYCLSSLEKGVRYFPQEYIFENLSYLINSGARQIKFLDRTFNLNKEHTRSVFDFLIANHRPNLSCQFEIYADLMTDDSIDYLNSNLPPNFFRFEIGIQSTYEPTNIAVKRKQDFPLLADNIKKLMQGRKVVLHLDLIAGLPYESFQRFTHSFNEVFALKAKEVQLGFLKMLRGTRLRNEADNYGYVYSEDAPYEIKYNNDISADDLHRIHEAEHALERYWNSGRFVSTMNEVFDKYYSGRFFEFFDELAQFYSQQHIPQIGYQLEDLFLCLHQFLLSRGIDLFPLLRADYYANYAMRPPGFWLKNLDKDTRKKLLYTIGQDKEFLKKHGLTRKQIEKQTAIDPEGDNNYLLTVFLDKKTRMSILYELTVGL
ncbi:B12-binding domain-containing radical SAM protein [Bacteroides sp. 519]|uniref:B12-binding domain-containing radical SAM protein n=1 Tax=Bacteroides sp. 519 TaxID=2302937 RepID=UPI0013D17FA9|nr:radical SAM protein [Bacteroides sp. 519]NDV60089.1 radical SAM protein [Bacteroides sp. 519]